MKEKVVERKRGFLGRFLKLEPRKEYRYLFDSIKDFLTSQYNDGIYTLQNLYVDSKTSEDKAVSKSAMRVQYATFYHFILKDDTGQIRVRALPEIVDISPITTTSIPIRNYSPETWSDIINVREGDKVDIAFSKGRLDHILGNLRIK